MNTHGRARGGEAVPNSPSEVSSTAFARLFQVLSPPRYPFSTTLSPPISFGLARRSLSFIFRRKPGELCCINASRTCIYAVTHADSNVSFVARASSICAEGATCSASSWPLQSYTLVTCAQADPINLTRNALLLGDFFRRRLRSFLCRHSPRCRDVDRRSFHPRGRPARCPFPVSLHVAPARKWHRFERRMVAILGYQCEWFNSVTHSPGDCCGACIHSRFLEEHWMDGFGEGRWPGLRVDGEAQRA